MRDELDRIPIIFCVSVATEGDYDQRKEPHLLSVENTDEDIMSINLFGPKLDYQLQVRPSLLLKLMKEEHITDEDKE